MHLEKVRRFIKENFSILSTFMIYVQLYISSSAPLYSSDECTFRLGELNRKTFLNCKPNMINKVDNVLKTWYSLCMGLKENIYQKLDASRGTAFSGEELAEEFGVSRAAVWKAVRTLRAEGFSIAAGTNRGYSLAPLDDNLTVSGVRKYLEDGFFLNVLPSCTSTNDEVKKLAAEGAPAWTAVLAEEQTAGRGRYARPFYSPRGAGLYISVLIRPNLPAAETLFITTSAAVAVCEAIEKIADVYAEIKWVNDVFLGGKKVCGILTEAAFNVESGGLDYAIVGIGINVTRHGFPAELEGIATSVFEDTPPADVRARLAAQLLKSLKRYVEGISVRSFYEEYKRRSFVLGKRVLAVSGDFSREGVVIDLDENCFLKIRFDDGSERLLSSGEVSIRIKTGD